jgi:hypothetical protein
MRFLRYVKDGLLLATRHKRLVLALWLVPLLPALLMAAMAAAYLMPTLGPSLFSDRVLTGDWFIVWLEMGGEARDAAQLVFRRGVILMGLVTLLLQTAVSAGVVEVALAREPKGAFFDGMRKNFLRFLRTSLLLLPGLAIAGVAAGLTARGLFKVAESQSDGRFDALGIALAAVVFVLIWAQQDLAADLSRIAAVRHDQRSMFFGFFRALWRVLKSPGLLVLYLVFLALPFVLQLVYYQVRAPWVASTAALIALSFLLQQILMALRAWLRLGMWGAEIAAYRGFDEPEFSRPRKRKKKRKGPKAPAAVEPLPEEAAEASELEEGDEETAAAATAAAAASSPMIFTPAPVPEAETSVSEPEERHEPDGEPAEDRAPDPQIESRPDEAPEPDQAPEPDEAPGPVEAAEESEAPESEEAPDDDKPPPSWT